MPGSLFDANVWVALTFASHPDHPKAKAALSDHHPQSPAAFCRATEQSYLRLITTPRLIAHYGAGEMTNSREIDNLTRLLDQPRVTFHQAEPPGTRGLWLELAARDTASPKLWMDAYLAAFAISGGLSFTTLDRDFLVYRKHGLELHLLTES